MRASVGGKSKKVNSCPAGFGSAGLIKRETIRCRIRFSIEKRKKQIYNGEFDPGSG